MEKNCDAAQIMKECQEMNKALTQLISKQRTINASREERNITINFLREKSSKIGGGLAAQWEELKQRDEELQQWEKDEEEKLALIQERQKLADSRAPLEAELAEYEEELKAIDEQNRQLRAELESWNGKNARLQALSDGYECEHKALSKRGLLSSLRRSKCAEKQSARVRGATGGF